MRTLCCLAIAFISFSFLQPLDSSFIAAPATLAPQKPLIDSAFKKAFAKDSIPLNLGIPSTLNTKRKQIFINDRTYKNASLLYFYISSFFLVALLINFNQQGFTFLIKSVFSNQKDSLTAREVKSLSIYIRLGLNLIFFFALGSLLNKVIPIATNNIAYVYHINGALFFAICLLLFYLYKYVTNMFLAQIFGFGTLAKDYLQFIFDLNKIVGVTILPLLFLIDYNDLFNPLPYYISIIIISILCLKYMQKAYNLSRGVLAGNTFHFLLYFCGIEILPLLIISKLIVNAYN